MKELFVVICFALLSPFYCEASENCLAQPAEISAPKEEVQKMTEEESVPKPKWHNKKRNEIIMLLSGNADPRCYSYDTYSDFPKLALNNVFLQLLQEHGVTKVIDAKKNKTLYDYFQQDKPGAIYAVWHLAKKHLDITDTVFLAALILCARCGNATWLTNSNLGTWMTVGIMLAQKFVEDTNLKAKLFADAFSVQTSVLVESEIAFLETNKYNCYIDPKEVEHLEDLLWTYKK